MDGQHNDRFWRDPIVNSVWKPAENRTTGVAMYSLEGVRVFRDHRDRFSERIHEPIGCGRTSAGIPSLRVDCIRLGEWAKNDGEHALRTQFLQDLIPWHRSLWVREMVVPPTIEFCGEFRAHGQSLFALRIRQALPQSDRKVGSLVGWQVQQIRKMGRRHR
jgi:hypothetical protein